RLKEAYDEWNRTHARSSKAWIELLAEDVCCHSLAGTVPGMQFTEPLHGKAAMLRCLSELSKNWELVHYTPGSFIAQGDYVAVLGNCAWRSLKTGKEVATPKADFFRFHHGRVVELWEFYDTAKAIAGTT